ncbi:MAG: LamG-like jellyroll fold domain-containing protein [Planctomycetota bacterium]
MTAEDLNDWRAELLGITRRLVDGLSQETDPARLAHILDSYDGAKELYLRYLETDALLAIRNSAGTDSISPLASIQPGAPSQSGPVRTPSRNVLVRFSRHAMAAGLIFVCGIATSKFWQTSDPDTGTNTLATAVESSDTEATQDALASDDAFVRAELVSNTVSDVAVVVRSDTDQGESLRVGTRLKPGRIKIDSGTMQLEFLKGAIVAIAAPAELELFSSDRATLHSGMARAIIPDRARGFVLNAPRTAVVDLGTEFSLTVGDNGTAEVSVIDGEVELSLLGDDGTTVLNRTVGTESTYLVNPSEDSMEPIAKSDSRESPAIKMRDNESLRIDDTYAELVRNQKPLLYWRFGADEPGVVSSETGDHSNGRIFGSSSEITFEAGVVAFDRGPTRYLRTLEPLVDLNKGSYTIEFWMNPDDLPHATCLGVCPVADESDLIHLNVVEIATDSFLIHEPGAIRFLHRNPPSKSNTEGFNVLSPGVCTPGRWQHIVVSKRKQQLELYWNGKLVKSGTAKSVDSEGAFHLYVGQLKPSSTMRQFAGRMDEIAVYPHALSADEVRLHYQTLVDQNPTLLHSIETSE